MIALGMVVRHVFLQDNLAGFKMNIEQNIEYGYSNLGRFKSVKSAQSADTNLFSYAYLPGSDLLSGYTASTLSTGSTLLTVSRSYEASRNLITSITNSVGSVPSVVSSFDYTNDKLGRRTQRSDYYGGSTTANTFDYNTFSEVTNALMNANEYSYDYDPIGNRNQEVKNAVATGYEANGLNQYTNITGGVVSAPTFDLDGNMTFLPSTSGGGAGGEGWHCQWDAENRLLTVSNLTTAVFASYTYDHQSRRIAKSVSSSSPLTLHTSHFIYDGWNLIQEQTSTNTSSFIPHTSSLFTWGLDLSGTLQGAGGVGGLLSQTKITASGASSYFPLADANGNAVTYLDDAGNVQAHYEYDAFGGIVSQSGDLADAFHFRFSSKYLDEETGLYYYGYRWYSHALGRWLNRDLIWEESFSQIFFAEIREELKKLLSAIEALDSNEVNFRIIENDILRLLKNEISTYGYLDNMVLNYYDYLGLQSAETFFACECKCVKFVAAMQKEGVRVNAKQAIERCIDQCILDPHYTPTIQDLLAPPGTKPGWNFKNPFGNWKTVLDALKNIPQKIKDKFKKKRD